MLCNEFGHWGYRLIRVESHLFLQNYLPLHICGLSTFAAAAALLFRIQILYEFAYFWGLVGSFNAILTPQLEVGFPQYRAFQYFVAHGGIVAGVLFSTLGCADAANAQVLIPCIPCHQSPRSRYRRR